MIRVVLADDEALMRAGVAAILGADPGIEVVAEAGDGREAVSQALATHPDVVLLDIRMPGLDGLGAAAEIRRLLPSTGVIMLTTFGEDEYIERALGLGAGGFLLKSGDPRELLAGIHAVAGGAAFLSPKVAQRVIARLSGGQLTRAAAARERISVLTPREREVLTLLGSGLSNADIAARMFVVEGTVKAHVSTILTRLGAKNRVQAAITAYEAGLTGGDAAAATP
ncbi:response regulator [Amycolatopsis solani]|uniref:response regulator n=1 Tax=Amycolatopsis solani TaxID=3028615 RepID=UPI0025B079F6|nr:response regulator transcription factor [Amycolatopsis sp. MEP2-6]